MTDNMGEINTIINKLSLINDNIANIYQRLDDIDKRNANMDYKFNNFKNKVDNMERMYNQRLLTFDSIIDKDKRYFKSIDKHEAPLKNKTMLQDSACSSRNNDEGVRNISTEDIVVQREITTVQGGESHFNTRGTVYP